MTRSSSTCTPALLLAALLLAAGAARAGEAACRTIRVCTYNTSLNRDQPHQLLAELRTGDCEQCANVSRIVQTLRCDVLVINEFDYEPDAASVIELQTNFLNVSQGPGLEPLHYPHWFTAPVNTGVPSGRDFDHDGNTSGPGDAYGFGMHPGQYGMLLLSMFPLDAAAVRTFQHLLWRDMPGALLPMDPATGLPWYSDDDLAVFRLSSKSHWDVPMRVPLPGDGSRVVHMLLHHPTPPAFDGRERRNVLRNHDEIRLFADYVGCGAADPAYLVDDAGVAGGLAPGASFIIAGDHNSDPLDGNRWAPGSAEGGAINQLLRCPAITAEFTPTSEGGREAGNRRRTDRTPAETKTSTFDLRVDYVLPSRDLKVLGGAVFWPVRAQQPQAGWLAASDHRPVFLEVEVCGVAAS